MGENSISKYKQSSLLLELQTGVLFVDYMWLSFPRCFVWIRSMDYDTNPNQDNRNI